MMITVEFPIVTERFVIRPMEERDVTDLFEVYRDPHTMRFLTDTVPATLEEATAWVRAKIELHERTGLSLWSVLDRATHEVVGDGGLQHETPEKPDIGIGGRLNRRYWGQGYAIEVGTALLAAGFDAGLDRIVGVTRPDNEAAVAACERLGMRFVERSRYFGPQDGDWVVYAAEAATWAPPAAGAPGHTAMPG
jgi:[ribosomal protein S5]-alanine N-acetyltransferase